MTIISLILQYFITFMSGPEMVSRIYAAKDEKEGVKATILSGIFMGLFAFIPAIIGIVALSTFPSIQSNTALSTVVFAYSPSIVAGIVCASIIAATMSSAGSDMLCASTIFTKDLYQRYINPKISDKAMITMTRVGNVIIELGAMCIALFQINIINLNLFSFMLRAAGPFAAFILGLTWSKASKHPGLASIVVGSAVGIYWQIMKEPYGILAIIAGLLAFVITTFIENSVTHKQAPPLEL